MHKCKGKKKWFTRSEDEAKSDEDGEQDIEALHFLRLM